MENNLLTLPWEIKAQILRSLLLTDENRVEHKSHWQPLDEGEEEELSGNPLFSTAYHVETNKEVSQIGYMANVTCKLETAIMLTCRQLYNDGRHILEKENKFIAVRGWSKSAAKELSLLGRIPVWKPKFLANIKLSKGKSKALNERFNPVLTVEYQRHPEKHSRAIILICLEDFPLVCKALYLSHSLPKYGPRLTLRMSMLAGRVSPRGWGLKTIEQVKELLQKSVIQYIGRWINHLYFDDHKVLAPTNSALVLGRPLNELEEWLSYNLQTWKVPNETAKYAFLHEKALSISRQAEQLFHAAKFEEAIPLYVHVKELVDRLCRTEVSWRKSQSHEVPNELYAHYSLACLRLGHIVEVDLGQYAAVNPIAKLWKDGITKFSTESKEISGFLPLQAMRHPQTVPRSSQQLQPRSLTEKELASAQWAYIHITLALNSPEFMEGELKRRARLSIRQAKLKALLGHTNTMVMGALMLACFAAYQHADPLDGFLSLRQLAADAVTNSTDEDWRLIWDFHNGSPLVRLEKSEEWTRKNEPKLRIEDWRTRFYWAERLFATIFKEKV